MDTQSQPTVKVTLLLQGGFQVGVELARDRRELREIIAALTPTDGRRASRLFHLNTGREILTVPSDHIVAVRTIDGTVALARQGPEVPLPPPAGSAPVLRFVGGEPIDFTRSRSHYPSPALIADGFLTAAEGARLLRDTLAHEAEFVRATTTTRAPGYRVSRVLFKFPQFETLVRARIAAVLPEVIQRFGIRDFNPGRIEAQLTTHNDGHFYKIHNDNSSATTAGRMLTYVYYFCREPRRFNGGGLRIYETVATDGYWRPGKTSYEVAPENNRIVFFPARYHHEVLPVVCPSRRFEDGRFTINGWVHQARTLRRTWEEFAGYRR